MIKFDVLNRSTGSVQFTAEIDCPLDALPSLKLGLAVKWAVKERANLRSADLFGADLFGANLYGADLGSADLRSADLRGANLGSANLGSANLCCADLRSADLRSANLRFANLRSVNLRFANLYGANLGSVNLRFANLYGADLGSNQKCSIRPVFFLGGTYDVMITDAHIKIGCQVHLSAEWRAFKSSDIEAFGGDPAQWKLFKPAILALAKAHQSRVTEESAP
jgi:hypothetical protein